jgi:hypothetical protein
MEYSSVQLAELLDDVYDTLYDAAADDGADDDEPSPRLAPAAARAPLAGGALVCWPALQRPSCRNARCIAICVCSSPTWAYDLEDDDAKSVTTETGDDESLEEVSLWDLIDVIADYESDVDTDFHHSDHETDLHSREESTPSPRMPIPLPPRKRYLQHSTGVAEPAKHGRFSNMLEPGFASDVAR